MTVDRMPVKYPMGPHLAGNWKLWQWMDIESSTNPGFVYLRRLRVIQTPWFSVLIHWIMEPDDSRYFHDHPWTWFTSWVLKGGYSEEFHKSERHFYDLHLPPLYNVYRQWSWHAVRMESAHRIIELFGPTVTLVFTGKRVRKFRFWLPQGPMDYDKVKD